MEVIRHDVAGNVAAVIDEFVAEIDPKDILAVREFADDLIHLQDFAALRIHIFTAREDGAKENFGFGQLGAEFLDDRANALGDLVGGIVFAVGIVGANHEDGSFRAEAVDVAVVEPPEHMLSAVTADPEIDRVVFREILSPDFLAGSLPAFGDRVADKDELRFLATLGGALVEEVLAVSPAAFARDRIDRGMAGGKSDLRRSDEGKECE